MGGGGGSELIGAEQTGAKGGGCVWEEMRRTGVSALSAMGARKVPRYVPSSVSMWNVPAMCPIGTGGRLRPSAMRIRSLTCRRAARASDPGTRLALARPPRIAPRRPLPRRMPRRDRARGSGRRQVPRIAADSFCHASVAHHCLLAEGRLVGVEVAICGQGMTG